MKFSRVKTFLAKHERRLSFGALATGFIVDSLTLTRIDQWLDNLILITYLLLAGGSISLLHYLKTNSKIRVFLPYVLQYAFGGLFSGFVIFYSRSGALIQSWPFLIILLFLLIGNEKFKERYEKYVFRMSMYFIALFSFFIFFIPVIVGKMGASIFILSGVVSLIAIALLIQFIERSKKSQAENKRRQISLSVISIYILFNILYFTNVIPPIPLSLKDIEIYNKIERVDNQYITYKENLPWYRFDKTNTVFVEKGDYIYAYSAIFAPTKIRQQISHVWSYKNEGEWEERNKVVFPIIGGRDGGYRGYTLKGQLEEGKWRVDVRTERGQLIGRKTFKVEYVEELGGQVVEVK